MGVDELVESVVAACARAAKLANREPDVSPPAGARAPRDGSRTARLATLLGMSLDELDFVIAAIARATEPRAGAHLRAVFGAEARGGLSVAQYAAVRELPAPRVRALLEALDARRPLRAFGIVETEDPFDVDARWSVPPRVWRYLSGSDELDATVAALGGLVGVPREPRFSDAQQHVLGKLATWLRDDTTIVLEGAVGSGRRTAIAMHRRVVTVDFARVAIRDAAATLVALVREATLSNAVPCLANLDELWTKVAPTDDVLLQLARAIDALAGPVVITTSMPGLELRAERRTIVRARWPIPDITTRRALWSAVAGGATDEELDLVAERYELGAGGIATAARSATRHASHRGEARPRLDDIIAGVQDNIAERLGELARRVEVKQDWDELVLPPDTFDDVRALVGRVRRAHFVLETWGFRQKLARGTGVAALFSGPPGTGKTMVAGLLARELQLELYQVDLSRIVSKWVGETEKQLAKVFEAAEAGHALLLFDEADALFAKRSAEVKSAVDRYANLEVNYLLQRVESFGGVVVLTTNLDTSIDPALRRRLASHIVFGAPEIDERIQLWRSMLSTGAPTASDLDLQELADEFSEMTGANIRNSVLAAAFLAAEEGREIGQAHLRRAARGEYRAMGRVLGRDHATRPRL
jgi:hypothetical protein